MYVYVGDQWHASHTDLSKFLLLRLAQLADVDEVITNRHATTNGLILLHEIEEIAELTLERFKNRHRLATLLREAADPQVPTSVLNDPVVLERHRTAAVDVQTWASWNLEPSQIRKIRDQAVTHTAALEPVYYECLLSNLSGIDLLSENFDKESDRIDRLLNALVSQLLYDGHSIAFLQLPPKKLDEREFKGELFDRISRYFAFDGQRRYNIFVAGEVDSDLVERLGAAPETLQEDDFWEPPEDLRGYRFEVAGKDPYSGYREALSRAYRRVSLRRSDSGPSLLRPFWEAGFYRTPPGKFAPYDFFNNNDPIVPAVRSDTFRDSLDKVGFDLQEADGQVLDSLEEPIHFYNLARTVPTVENSYILLWTALESLMGLRANLADIQVVQENVAPAIALGSVARRSISTISRLRLTGSWNSWPYLGPSEPSEYETAGLATWIEWIVDITTKDTPQDPYETLKADPLLCRQWRRLNESWRTLGNLLKVVLTSEKLVRYQLDRIYVQRNRIIHSGRFAHTAKYLWVHLEWYVGKMLAQAVLILDRSGISDPEVAQDRVAGALRGQFAATVDYLERHAEAPINAAAILASGLTRYPALGF